MMRRALSIAVTAVTGLAAGCGGGGTGSGPGSGSGSGSQMPPTGLQLVYTDPSSGALRLVRDPAGLGGNAVTLRLVVGDQPLTGYATGFDLPLDTTKVVLGAFTPGAALAPGEPPLAARAVIPKQGPLAGMLVTALSQKASGPGAVATDAVLGPGSVLYSIELDLAPAASDGVVFDGTATGFALPSGGLRNRTSTVVVSAGQVGIGKLEVR